MEEAEFEYILLTLDIGELSPFEGSALDLPVELEDGSKIYWETSDIPSHTLVPGQNMTLLLVSSEAVWMQKKA